MVKWWISDNQIVGEEQPGIGLPANFQEVEGVNLPLDQVYFDGETVTQKPEEPSSSAQWDSSSNQWVEPPQEPDPPIFPNYLEFRVAMLQNPAYDRVTLASNILRVTRMETAISQNPPELSIVATMWGVLIDELAVKPTTVEVKGWNAIAKATNVPLTFGKDGKMNLV